MTKQAWRAIFAALLIAILAHPASAADRISIRDVDLKQYPRVEVTVSGATDPDSLRIYEEGSLISELEARSLAEADAAVDVVLAIDTSGSMAGAAMDSAIDAATSFVRGLPDYVRIGVVAFSSRPQVLQPLTKELDAGLRVITGLTPSGETALYDGVAASARLFKGAAQRNIILLSDGADTASERDLAAAAGVAKDRRVAIFSVGIEGSEQDVGALKQMSRITGGSYAPAAAAELTAVYESLASDLTDQVVLSYTSDASEGAQVPIRVTSSSGVDTAVILAPAEDLPEAAPAPPGPSEPILSGTYGLVVVLGSAFLAIFLTLFWFFGSRATKRRDAELSRRFGVASTRPSAEGNDEAPRPGSWIPDPLVGMADQIARTGGLSSSLDVRLQRSGWKVKVGEFLAGAFLAGLGGGLLGFLLAQNVVLVVAAAALGAAIPFILLSIRTRKRLSKLHSQLPDILMIMASSLRAGHSFLQSLSAVAQEAGEPGAHEFERLITEIRLGRPATTAMNDLAERIGSPDFRWAVLAVDIQRDIGGNLSEVLDTVAQTMRERDRVRRQVDVLSTEGRMSIYILAGLPIGVALYMGIANPEYIGLLFTTTIGLVMLTAASILLVTGILWMKKVVKIRV